MAQKNFISRFWLGFWAPLRALKLVFTSPVLFSLLIIPLAINVGLYIVFFYHGSEYVSTYIQSWNEQIATSLPAWAQSLGVVLTWILRLLGWLVLLVVAALSFTLVSGLICAPFNDLISKQTSRLREKSTTQTNSPIETKIYFLDTIKLELRRLLILIVGGTIAFGIGLIPLLQVPAMALASFLISFEYFGYPIARRTSSLSPVWSFTFKNFSTSIGFGGFLLLMMAIPFASVFYIPLAVIAGTLLHDDLKDRV